MNFSFDDLYRGLRRWATDHGVCPDERPLPAGKAGDFDGLSITMNHDYSAEDKSYYFAHALGSIALWCVDPTVQAIFDGLRSAKASKTSNPAGLEMAIDRFRGFEIESSQLAVWLLEQVGFRDAVPSYTNFMRADLESITQYHRTGNAPVWRTFFARWNEEARAGQRRVELFHPQEIPQFSPRSIERQEILQEQGDTAGPHC